jgi:hypothetical protein
MEYQACGRGGTGRRKGLKIPRWQRRAGSSPAARTSKNQAFLAFSGSASGFGPCAESAISQHPVLDGASPAPEGSPVRYFRVRGTWTAGGGRTHGRGCIPPIGPTRIPS